MSPYRATTTSHERRQPRKSALLRYIGSAMLAVLVFALTLQRAFAQSLPSPDDAGDTGDAIIDRVLAHVDVLARDIGPRPLNSRAAERAAEYIESQLSSYGLPVERRVVGEVRLPRIALGPLRFYDESRIHVTDANLWVTFAPPASENQPALPPALLIMAHYDTVHGAPGALDNGVSVAIALELARSLAAQGPARPVIIAFTAAEEHRLAGAHALADILAPRVGLALSMDLVGGPGTLTLNGLGPHMGADWLRHLASVAERADVPMDAPIPHRVISRHWPQIERSDHGVFAMRDIPAVHLYTRAPGHIYLPYHSYLDTADHVSRASVARTTRFVHALARTQGAFPRSDGDRGFWVPGTRWVVPSWSLSGLELGAVGWIAFVLSRLFLAGRARRPRREPPDTTDTTDATDTTGTATRGTTRGLGLLLFLPVYAVAWLGFAALMYILAVVCTHPMPWVHDPGLFIGLGVLFATAVVILGVALGARRWTVVGENRYLFTSLCLCLLLGVCFLGLRVPELAWLPLVMAVFAGALPYIGSRALALLVFVASLTPFMGALDPDFLREVVFNGFWPSSLPIAGILALMLAPSALTAMYLWQRFGLVLRPRVWLLAATVALLFTSCVTVTRTPTCSGRDFTAFNLACELPGIAAMSRGGVD